MGYPLPAKQPGEAQEQVSCCSLPAHVEITPVDENEQGQRTHITVASASDKALRAAFEQHVTRSTPLSLLLLQITCFEHIQMPPGSPIVHKCLRRQASISLLEQVIHIARRTLRADDQVLVDARAAGAIFLFPQVDQEGILHITERVSYNIHLLQAETVVPPLQHEMEIILGFGSYPEPASSFDELISHGSQIQERVIFRPAVLPRPDHARSRSLPSRKAAASVRARKARSGPAHASSFPFMQIPSRLPARLKQLIPYPLALDLRCAPVGRDHNRLTVAMANPADARAIGHLRAATGMAIFPVACEISALESLLASGW